MKKFNAEQVARVLAEIQSRIPTNLRNNVAIEVDASPTVKFIAEQFLASDAPEESKKEVRTLYELGEFSKKKVVEDHKIAKLINQFITREINKAIKQGKLPPRSKIGDITGVKEMYEKVYNIKN